MILNCTLPYWQDISNPALGYLKGFLETKGIHVRNVYWNLILDRKISNFQRSLGDYSKGMGPFHAESTAFYICRRLLTEDCRNSGLTTSDLLFSSIYSKEEIYETINSIKDEIDRYIQQNKLHDVLIAGFTLKTYQWLMSCYLIQRLKEMNPEINILIGGITDEPQARTFMRIFNLADFAIWGEGEFPLVHLVEALEEGTDIRNVPYLVYRDGNRILSTGARSEPCSHLDSYPFADHSDYFYTLRRFTSFKREILIPIWGSRSCNWNKCKFCCLYKEYTYRERSPENIVREIEFQSKKYNIDNFFFMDSDVAGNKKRFMKFLKLLVDSVENRKRPYRLYAMISPLFINSEAAEYMKRAKFVVVQAGFEAMTDSLLEKMQKRHRFAHNIQALKAANHYNLPQLGLNIMRGIPTEKREDVIESCENLKFLRFLLHKYHFDLSIFLLAKGSPFYDEMPEEDRKSWKEDVLWEEVAPIHLIPESDRFEFFWFFTDRFNHYHLWNNFENLLKFFSEQKYTCEWIESPDGSIVEEKGHKILVYKLEKDETDLLIYCDSIRKFSEIKKIFSHLSEDKLLELLSRLKDLGLLYYDKNANSIISTLEAARRKTINKSHT